MKIDKSIKAMPWPEEYHGGKQDFAVTLAWPTINHERLLVATFVRNRDKRVYRAPGPDFRMVCSKKQNTAAILYKGDRAGKRHGLDKALGSWGTHCAYCYPEITKQDEIALAKWLRRRGTNNHLMSAYSDVLVEQAKNSIGLTKAQYALDAANQKVSDTQARMNQLTNEATKAAEKYNSENGTAIEYTEFLADEYYDLRDSLSELNNEVADAEQEVETYNEALKDDEEAAAAAKNEIAMLDDVIADLTGTQEEAASETGELSSAIDGVREQLVALADAYDEAYGAAMESIRGQYDLWDEAEKVVATSASSINSALESQITYWQDYNANLQSLTERSADIEGLSEVIASFADGSTDSVNAIAGLANASDEDLRAMVANWQELQKEQEAAAGSVADLKTDFTATMDELQEEFAADIEAMNLADDAAESARSTINAFIHEADAMLPQVQAAYDRLGRAAITALGLNFTGMLGTGSGTSSTTSASESALAAMRTIPTTDLMLARLTGAYASGTLNAATGLALVGEQGPELVNFRGGEQVMPAAETAAMLNGLGGEIRMTVAPVYQIEGGMDPDRLQAVLDGNNEKLRELVQEVIEEARTEALRRAYR